MSLSALNRARTSDSVVWGEIRSTSCAETRRHTCADPARTPFGRSPDTTRK